MAKTLMYACRRCDKMTEEPLENYTSHPNTWVYFDGLCEPCSEIARAEHEARMAGDSPTTPARDWGDV